MTPATIETVEQLDTLRAQEAVLAMRRAREKGLSDSGMAWEIARAIRESDERSGLATTPIQPTSAMWQGLARQIVMAWDLDCMTPGDLFAHLERSGVAIPQWLRDESEMSLLEHVPSKGTRAAIIYKAMLSASPFAKEGGE
jgi:hypothetical protein